MEHIFKTNSFELLVPTQEYIATGCVYKFGNLMFTVFGAANYYGVHNNFSGILNIKDHKTREITKLSPLAIVKRIHF